MLNVDIYGKINSKLFLKPEFGAKSANLKKKKKFDKIWLHVVFVLVWLLKLILMRS